MNDTIDIIADDWKPLVHPIFAACVDPRGTARYDLTRPFVVDGTLYATDNRIIVRGPVPDGWSIPNAERFLRSAATIFEGEYHAEPVPIPAIEGRCEECKGAGLIPAGECEECGGSGEDGDPICDCPHCTGSHPCEECDGTGGVEESPCRRCVGSGVKDGADGIELAPGYTIRRDFAALLDRHGATAYLHASPCLKGRMLRFTVGEIEGRLMPMERGVTSRST